MSKFFRIAGYLVFTVLCWYVAYYAFSFLYQSINLGNSFQVKVAYSGWAMPTHFFGAGLALLLAPLQVSQTLRSRWLVLHRIGGLASMLGIAIGGISGLVLAQNADGGIVSQLGFTLLSIVWLAVTGLGFYHVFRGNIRQHRIWMYRSVALTASAVTLRVFLGLGIFALDMTFLEVYVPSSWLCWLVNLAIVELLIGLKLLHGLGGKHLASAQ